MKFFILSSFLILAPLLQVEAASCRAKLSQKQVPESRSPKLVVISGTNRAGSSTLKISRQVVNLAEAQGIQVELLDIAKVPLNTYRSDGYWNTPRSFQKNYDAKIQDADAVVIIFPEYNGSYPGMLKAFLDYTQVSFSGKRIALVGISDGQWGSIRGAEDLRTTLNHRKAETVGQAQVLIPGVNKVLNGKEVIEDSALVARMQSSIQELVAPILKRENDQTQILKLAADTQSLMAFKFNSGVTIQSRLSEVLRGQNGEIIFMRWSGTAELFQGNQLIAGQGRDRHPNGFSTPLGTIQVDGLKKSLSSAKSLDDLKSLGIDVDSNRESILKFSSGIVVRGKFSNAQFSRDGTLQVLTFDEASSSYGSRILYQKDWGPLDLLIGERLEDVQGI